jgi:hypothetical protein
MINIVVQLAMKDISYKNLVHNVSRLVMMDTGLVILEYVRNALINVKLAMENILINV